MADEEVREEDEWLYGESTTAGELEAQIPAADSEDVKPRKAKKRKLGEDDEGEEGLEDEDAGEEGEERVVIVKGEGQGLDEEVDTEAAADDALGENDEASDNGDDDDDDSDEDGVQVVIGDIKGGQSAQTSSSTAFAAAAPPKRVGPPPDKKGKFGAEDFEGAGTINGVPALDFSLDSLEEKPWRKPGADITDYFNYGFTEETWRFYCDKQKRLRYDSGASTSYSANMAKGGGQQGSNVDSKSGIVFPKKFNNMGGMGGGGGRKEGMGMGQMVRREEPRENTIQVRVVMTADRREYGRKGFDNMNIGPPMIPPPFNMNLPPPPFPPPPEFMGPEFFNHPPPGYYQEEEEPGYDEQQWMDSQWEMGMEGSGMGPSPSVVPLTKAAIVPPPPGDDDDMADVSSSVKMETGDK